MKKVSKAILIGFSVLAILGIALVVSLNLYIQSPGSQARIQEELSKSLRLPLKLTSVSVSPFGGLRITGITIPNGGANLLEAAAFNASYRLLPLLQGKLVIPEMNVQQPKIVWVQAPDGKWKLPEPQQAANAAAKETTPAVAKAPKTEKSNFAVIVERFDIQGGTVELLDTENQHVAVFTNVNATFTSLTADHVEGTATIDKAVWKDSLTLENIRAPFKYAEGAFNVPEMTAALGGGTISGRYHTHTEPARSPFKIALTVNKLDLDRIGMQMGVPAGQTVGLLSGQVECTGDALQPDRYQGEGHLDLRDAQFRQLDLFQNIGGILGIPELSDLRVRDGHADVRLSGEKIMVDKFVLNTSDLQLAAHGTGRLDKKLNLTAQLSAADAVVQRLPGMIRDSFGQSTDGRRAIDFNITGSADKPKTNLLDKLVGLKINTQFGDVLSAIFGGEKKHDDNKPKKDEQPPDKERKKKEKSAPQNTATPASATPAPSAAPAPSTTPAAPATSATPPPQPAAANP